MFFFFQAEDGIRDVAVTGVQTCALPIYGLAALESGHDQASLVGSDLVELLAQPHRHAVGPHVVDQGDRKSTRLNSSHGYISYAVFCLKKKKQTRCFQRQPLSQLSLDLPP